MSCWRTRRIWTTTAMRATRRPPGKLDYDRYVSLLHEYRFEGPLLLHGLSEAQVPGCVAFLREKLARLASALSGK